MVEDNVVNQKVIRLLLAKFGCSADIVGDGAEALVAVRSRPYILVLMDEQMPIMDGLTATRLIRKEQRDHANNIAPCLRIIAMTANAMASDRQACLDAGMDDYLAKPIKPELLRDMLARYIPFEWNSHTDSPSCSSDTHGNSSRLFTKFQADAN